MDRPTTQGIVPGLELGKALVQALGLPPNTTLIQMRIGLDAPVEVIARYYPSQDAMEQVVAILAKYQLVCREEAPDDPGAGTPVMAPIAHTGDRHA